MGSLPLTRDFEGFFILKLIRYLITSIWITDRNMAGESTFRSMSLSYCSSYFLLQLVSIAHFYFFTSISHFHNVHTSISIMSVVIPQVSSPMHQAFNLSESSIKKRHLFSKFNIYIWVIITPPRRLATENGE